MTTSLAPCPSCFRHVRRSELACPFCTSVLTPTTDATVPSTRLGRAAVFAFRTTTAAAFATLSACGEEPPPAPPTPPTTIAPIDAIEHVDDNIAQPYGAPPMPPTTLVPEPPPTEVVAPHHHHTAPPTSTEEHHGGGGAQGYGGPPSRPGPDIDE